MSTSTTPWRFEPMSVVDPIGRVLHRDGRVFRAIRPEYAAEMRHILDVAEKAHWFDHGLVPTWTTEYQLTEYPLVLEHRRIRFVTLRGEWPAEALRQAAIRYLDLAATLARSGYCLKDAHTFNVLFDGAEPVVTDFGSIRPLAELDWTYWLTEFKQYFLAPLALFAAGEDGRARALLREHMLGLGLTLIARNDAMVTREWMQPPAPYEAPGTFEALRARVEALSFPVAAGEWTSYPQPAFDTLAIAPRPKEVALAQLLDRLQFSSAVDLGSNRGIHTFMCEARGADVVACDIDEACLNDLYTGVRTRRARVWPVHLDLAWPLGSGGAFLTIPPATERLRGDVVLALGLVHHLALRQRYHVDVLARAIAGFGARAAIVEFVPHEDWHVQQWGMAPPPDYHRDGFIGHMNRYFERVTIVPSDPAPRELLLFESPRAAGTTGEITAEAQTPGEQRT